MPLLQGGFEGMAQSSVFSPDHNKSGAAMVTEGLNENQSAGTSSMVAHTHSHTHKQQLQHTYLVPTFVTGVYPYG